MTVFNTLGWPRTDVARGDVGFSEGGVKDFDVIDPTGKFVPKQLTEANHYKDGGIRRVKFAFVARDIPALGHSVYRVVARQNGGTPKTSLSDTNGGNVLENSFYRAGFDPGTGALTNLLVKAGDWQALKSPANVVAREKDVGDFWELYQSLGDGSVMMTRPLPVPQAGQATFSTDEGTTNSTLVCSKSTGIAGSSCQL